jgi:hypothetical protein
VSSSLKLGERFRREVVIDDLIAAVQSGLFTGDEYERARKLLHATGFTLKKVVGVPTDLLAKILHACPMLRDSAEIAPTPASEEQSPKITAPTNSIDPNEGFGLQPQPLQHKGTIENV